jgi:hypothetical protein
MQKPLSPKNVEPYNWDDLIYLLTHPYGSSISARQAAKELIEMKQKIYDMNQLLNKYIDKFGEQFE